MNTTPPNSVAPEIGPPPVPQREGSFYYGDIHKPKLMLACNEAELPEVCLITGEPTGPSDRRKRRLLTYNPPWIFVTIILGLIPLLLLLLVTQKKCYITYSLSKTARSQITRKRLLGLLFTFVAILLIGVSFSNGSGWLLFIAIILLIASLVTMVIADPIKTAGFRKEWFRIKGVAPSFLATLEQRQF